jgi:transcriptional regulator with XRE-family HTH domain
MLDSGLKLRSLRERLGLTLRDVESASVRIAERHGNDEFAVSPSRLSDIETKGLVPSIFRLYSLAVIYQMDIRELLVFYGVDTALVDRERSDLGLTSPGFTINFSPDLTPQQIRLTLQALAEYYRACGGIGFQIDFELEQILVREPVYV